MLIITAGRRNVSWRCLNNLTLVAGTFENDHYYPDIRIIAGEFMYSAAGDHMQREAWFRMAASIGRLCPEL
jgi:hypothetical protein